MKIVGVCSGHDVAYGILEDGVPVVHNEIERFSRVKEEIGDGFQFLFDTLMILCMRLIVLILGEEELKLGIQIRLRG